MLGETSVTISRLRLWSIPRGCDLVYFGEFGIEVFELYITTNRPFQFACSRKYLNIWVLLLSLRYGCPSWSTYYKAFLRIVKPKWVITFEDNSELFHQTKQLSPNVQCIAVQNGRRDYFSNSPTDSFFSNLSLISQGGAGIDVVATFGSAPSILYRKAVSASTDVLSVGSIKNNAFSREESDNSTDKPRLLYVSSFTDQLLHSERSEWLTKRFGYWHSSPLSFEEMFRVERIAVQYCAEFARQRKIDLVVLGKRARTCTGEYSFFKDALQSYSHWEYKPSDDLFSSYREVRTSDKILNVDSTFGYEMFARGVRVAFFSGRMHLAGKTTIKDCDFGFPAIDERRGAFWTSEGSQVEFNRITDFIFNSDDTTWSKASKPYDHIFEFDPGNSRLCALLNQFGIPNRGPRTTDSVSSTVEFS